MEGNGLLQVFHLRPGGNMVYGRQHPVTYFNLRPGGEWVYGVWKAIVCNKFLT